VVPGVERVTVAAGERDPVRLLHRERAHLAGGAQEAMVAADVERDRRDQLRLGDALQDVRPELRDLLVTRRPILRPRVEGEHPGELAHDDEWRQRLESHDWPRLASACMRAAVARARSAVDNSLPSAAVGDAAARIRRVTKARNTTGTERFAGGAELEEGLTNHVPRLPGSPVDAGVRALREDRLGRRPAGTARPQVAVEGVVVVSRETLAQLRFWLLGFRLRTQDSRLKTQDSMRHFFPSPSRAIRGGLAGPSRACVEG
jgi:hypothetical protein